MARCNTHSFLQYFPSFAAVEFIPLFFIPTITTTPARSLRHVATIRVGVFKCWATAFYDECIYDAG